jgi:MFS family permease
MTGEAFGSLDPAARRAVLKYGAFRALSSAGFATPFFVVFMVGNGVTYTDIGLGTALMAVVVIALEVPSGYLADAFGRRRTMFLSQAFLGLGTVGYVVADGTPDVAATYLAFGVGAALKSGAGTAWFYDTLKRHDAEGSFAAVSGTLGSYVKGVSTATMIGGGLLYVAEPVYAIGVGAAANLLAAPVVLALPASREADGDDDAVGPRTAARLAGEFLGNPAVRTALLIAVLASGALYTASKYIQPVTFAAIPEGGYAAAGVAVPSALLVAATYAAFELGSGVALGCAEATRSRLGLGGTVAVAFAGSAACMIAPLFVPAATVPAVVGMMSLQSLASPGVRQYLNEYAASTARATLNSAKSFLNSLLRIPVMLGSGVAADAVSPTVAMAGVGAAFLLASGVVAVVDRPVFARREPTLDGASSPGD